MSREAILEGLNAAQREAVTAIRGPVVILAGAGTGKTTTITHRIAYQVATGAFSPEAILAVTFTDKAAGELKARLRNLGVAGVEVRTFHAAALAQLSRLWPRQTGNPLPDILDSKAPLLSSLANALPPPHRFVPRREFAAEIEWAKNRMIPPERYIDELGDHVPPIPAELMHRVYVGYERRKRLMGRLDFEDMPAFALQLFQEHPLAADAVRGRFAAFTVDEYQDVNPLQAALLDQWLGARDELCVVGDDYQTIYTFTGASPSHLLGFPRRFPQARVVRLEANYRSTPEVLEVANRLARTLGGFPKTLHSTRPPGPQPVIRSFPTSSAEIAHVVDEVRRVHDTDGVAYEEMAVLYRINARSEPFEQAFAEARIPFQVRDGAFLRRPGPRAVLHRLRREGGSVVDAVDAATSGLGFDPDAEPDAAEEVTRQADLARLRGLAREFHSSKPEANLAEFVAELNARFSAEQTGRGVNLLTYHRAKGLEFDVVFLPRLLDGELPFGPRRSRAPEPDERRLLYVGITRARRRLTITWPLDVRQARSPFVEDLAGGGRLDGASGTRRRRPSSDAPIPPLPNERASDSSPLFDALKRWRVERSRADGVPAYVIFHDTTLASIAATRPSSRQELLSIAGIGPAKLERYGDELLALVSRSTEARSN